MSRKRQNNHYHYAEQFADRARRKKRFSMPLPRRTVFFALLILILFGTITVTFSTNTPAEVTNTDRGSILVKLRSSVGSSGSTSRTAADIADTGAKTDIAPTAAQTYYYSGQGNGTNWTKTAMTVSADGFYEYYYVSSTTTHQFKIGTSSNQYAYNKDYVSSGFNGTNVSEIGDYGGDNCYCWKGSEHYIIVYYPSTKINSSTSPKICASTTLPSIQIKLGEFFTNSGTATFHNMTNNAGTWTYSMNLTGGVTRDIFFQIVYDAGGNTVEYYKDQNEATMTYDHCTDWQFEQNNKGNPKLATVTTGSYDFSFIYSSKKVSVVYPKYNVTLSKSPAAASSGALTPSATTQVAVGSGITISAPAAGTGYEWVNWTVTGGTVKTGSYTGTNMTSSTTRQNLTVYPYGANTTITLQANYKVQEFTITYKSDADTPTAYPNTITNPATNSVPSSEQKQYNVYYTITSNTFTRPHYTQVGWATAPNYTSQLSSGGTTYYGLGANYATNANLTLYPVWELNAPKKSNTSTDDPEIISTGTMTIGSTPVDLNLLESDVSHDATRAYSYTWTGSSGTSGAPVSVGTNPGASNFMKFTADTPGEYQVTVTLTDTSTTGVVNTNSRASAATNTATITVQPDTPVFDITGYNMVVTQERDGSTAEKACKIILGNRYYFSAQVDSAYLNTHPAGTGAGQYTYIWATDSAFTNIINPLDANDDPIGTPSITFTNEITGTNPRVYTITLITYDPQNPPADPANDPRTLADESHGLENVTLYLRAICNGVSKDSADKWLFYFIQPLIESFKYEPMQKIYNRNDETVSLAAEYNIENDPSYITRLYFSHDNNTYGLALPPSYGFIESFFTAIKAYLYPNGPKFFYLEMEGYNSQHELIVSRSDKIHTTVGTSDSTTSRALYFNNSTGVDLKNYLVMCYYIDGSGTLCYQAAQDLNKGDENNEGLHYRVMIPQNTQAVRFGFLARDIDRVRYYGKPTVTNGEIGGFSVPIYFGYTDQITLTDSVSRVDATVSTDVGSLKSFTCTAGAY